MKTLATTLACLAVLATGSAAHAADDFWYLKNSPASKFTPADFKLLRAAMDKALADDAGNTPQTWRNEQTGAAGTVTPVDDAAAAPCKKLQVANSYQTLKAEGIYTFCRQRDGRWTLK